MSKDDDPVVLFDDDGAPPEVWNPPTKVALNHFVFGYPDDPTVEEQADMLAFLRSLRTTLPCPTCRGHWGDMCQHDEGAMLKAVQSRTDLVKWWVDRNNDVRKRLGKSPKCVEELVTEYKAQCSAARAVVVFVDEKDRVITDTTGGVFSTEQGLLIVSSGSGSNGITRRIRKRRSSSGSSNDGGMWSTVDRWLDSWQSDEDEEKEEEEQTEDEEKADVNWISSWSPRWSKIGRRLLAVGVAVTVLLLLLALFSWWWWRKPGSTQSTSSASRKVSRQQQQQPPQQQLQQPPQQQLQQPQPVNFIQAVDSVTGQQLYCYPPTAAVTMPSPQTAQQVQPHMLPTTYYYSTAPTATIPGQSTSQPMPLFNSLRSGVPQTFYGYSAPPPIATMAATTTSPIIRSSSAAAAPTAAPTAASISR